MTWSQTSSSRSTSSYSSTLLSTLAPCVNAHTHAKQYKTDHTDNDDGGCASEIHPYQASREYTQKVLNQLSRLFMRLSDNYHEMNAGGEGDRSPFISTQSGIFGINLAQYRAHELMEHRKFYHPNSFNTVLHMHADAIGYEGPIR